MSDESGRATQQSDPVAELLAEIRGTWSGPCPAVLLFKGEMRPVVADVRGDLRMMSSAVVYARSIEEADVREAYDRRGEPRVVALSTQSARFGKEDFEEVVGLE